MEQEFLHGQMEEGMKDHFWMIKNMDRGHLPGRMGVSILVNGNLESNMEKEFQLVVQEKERKEYGRMVKSKEEMMQIRIVVEEASIISKLYF